eukprot:1156549-Pelagomonas_calceolata.AAC.4
MKSAVGAARCNQAGIPLQMPTEKKSARCVPVNMILVKKHVEHGLCVSVNVALSMHLFERELLPLWACTGPSAPKQPGYRAVGVNQSQTLSMYWAVIQDA